MLLTFSKKLFNENRKTNTNYTEILIYGIILVNGIDGSEQAILTIPHTTIVLSDNFLRDEKH